MRIILMAGVGVALSSSVSAQPALDGIRDPLYGPARAVQTVQTQFGDASPDNGSELDAAYARIDSGALYILLTGNLQNNFNRLNIFIDACPGGQQSINLAQSPANDGWAAAYDGFTFDPGFAADYLLILRNGASRFDIDFTDLTNGTAGLVEAATDVFSGSLTGSNIGALASTGIGVAHNGSNIAGVTAGTGAADQAAAAAVTTGIELRVPLTAIGNPTGALRVCAMININTHLYLSNQFLGGLTPPQGNLGANGVGSPGPSLGTIDLSDFPGTQSFDVPCPGDLTDDAVVDVDDLNVILSQWNTPGPIGDINHDSTVDVDDLNVVLSNWACSTRAP